MSCSVVGSVSVLLMRWPGGGSLLLVESDRVVGCCVQTFFRLVGMQLGGCPKGSHVLFLWSASMPLSWMAIVKLLLCLLLSQVQIASQFVALIPCVPWNQVPGPELFV